MAERPGRLERSGESNGRDTVVGMPVTPAWTAFVHVKAAPGRSPLPDEATGGFTYVSAKCDRGNFEQIVRRDASERGLTVENFEWICAFGAEPSSGTPEDAAEWVAVLEAQPIAWSDTIHCYVEDDCD